MTFAEEDPYLAERIRARLATDARCGELGLVVRVARGRVFISGAVPSDACREAVAEVAIGVAGSVLVANETHVTPVSSPGSDHEVLL